MFDYFKNRKLRKTRARVLYDEIVAAARQPVFYEDLSVPDSVDGRFELISLHTYIMIHRINVKGDKKLSQTLFDVFFKNMERSLREMGIGDLGVPKHMKRMMQGFNGRCRNYEGAFEDKALLKEALIRNVYGTVESPHDMILDELANYVQQCIAMGDVDAGFAPIKVKEEKQRA